MSKQEFLDALRAKLEGLEDIEASLEFYGEAIDDRMESGLTEQEAVAEIGSVEEVAAQILSEMPLPKLIKARATPKGKPSGWQIALIVLGSPVWLPLLLAAASSSGRVSLTNVTCASLNAQTSSGGIRLTDVIALDTLHAQSSSGSVRLTRCDGATLNIRTSSGSVSGTLLSDKVFLTDTSSGSINVPRTVTGGVCEVTTSSGSIKLAYEN